MGEFLGRWMVSGVGVWVWVILLQRGWSFWGIGRFLRWWESSGLGEMSGTWGLGWGTGAVGEGFEGKIRAQAWVALVLWVGFVNALVRPVFMELCGMRLRGGWLFAGLWGSVAVVNGGLFGFLGFWEPGLEGLDWGWRMAGALLVGGVTALASSVFHSRDGRWRWITYHGSAHDRRRHTRTVPEGPAGGGGGGG